MSIYYSIFSTASLDTTNTITDPTYATALANEGTTSALATLALQHSLSGGNYIIGQAFVTFDLSGISSISTASVHVRPNGAPTNTDNDDIELRSVSSVSNAVASTNLGGLTLRATRAADAVFALQTYVLTSFPTPSATTSFIFHFKGNRTETTPTAINDSDIYGSTQTGTTLDPYITLTTPTPWSFVGNSAAVTVAASGNITPTEPSGVAQGDLLVACIAYRDTAAFTLPSGGEWTVVATQQSSGNAVATNSAIASGLMAYCVRGASAPNFAFTRTSGNVALARVYAYRGVNTTTPYDTGSANTLGADSATATTGTFTTAEDDELIVAMVSGGQEGTVSAFLASSASPTALVTSGTGAGITADPAADVFQERTDDQTTTGGDTSLTVADAVKTGAGATGTIQATHTNASVQHVMIAGAFKLAQALTKARPLFRRSIMFFRRSF